MKDKEIVKSKEIVSELSNTQRLTVKKYDSAITILKEYRKDGTHDWITSKGISVPREIVPKLIEVIKE